jgi:hypothetical protein
MLAGDVEHAGIFRKLSCIYFIMVLYILCVTKEKKETKYYQRYTVRYRQGPQAIRKR